MGSILEAIEDWIRGLLVSGIMGNLTSIFDSVNNQVGQIATEVGRTPASFSPAKAPTSKFTGLFPQAASPVCTASRFAPSSGYRAIK